MSGSGIAYGAALALAVVFTVAAVAKLRRRRSTTRAFAALGLASPAALAIGIPLAELALAAGLVVVPSWGGIVALAVLAGFTTFLVRSIRRGDVLGCGCFASTRPEPAGEAEVVRNAVLAAAAVLAAFAPGPIVPGVGDIVVVAVSAVVARALVSSAARRSPVVAPRSGPTLRSVAPALVDLRYEDHPLTLVAFVAPTCEGCTELRQALSRHPRADHGVRVIDLDDRSAVDFAAFGVRSTPYLVVVDAFGRIHSAGPARSPADITALIAR